MEPKEKKPSIKTFEEMGVNFSEGSGCHTCRDNSCHNTVPLRRTGEDYNVHISTDPGRTTFRVHASVQANTVTDDEICQDFTNESDAVKFVCDTFEWFQCF
ncbi:MAG: hypothetical protein JST75_03780 [Bacteroidetes bacterium]|nr:hypothetical protein [Bacteroidota bacterium]